MNEEILMWMNRTYPEGFFCADLTNSLVSRTPFEALSLLGWPILLHLKFSQLQELVSRLTEEGISANTACMIPDKNISTTLGNLLLKSRPLQINDLFLVIGE